MESLSGGNQQRMLLALLRTRSPCSSSSTPRGAWTSSPRIYIWGKLKERCAQGAAIVFISSDLDEVLQYSDRVLVFFAGRVSPPLAGRALNVEPLGELIGGKGWERFGAEPPMRARPRVSALFQVAAVVLALLLTTIVLLVSKAPPLAAYANIILGRLGSLGGDRERPGRPGCPCSWPRPGCSSPSPSGLWNIGIEGQITLGAIFTTWVPPPAAGQRHPSRAHHHGQHRRRHGGRSRSGRCSPAR